LDLPLKALVWEDVYGKVWLSYNRPEYLEQRHSIPNDLLKNISGIRTPSPKKQCGKARLYNRSIDLQ
jgi:hypothetical protein